MTGSLEAVAPVSCQDIVTTATRIGAYLAPTPLRRYPALDAAVGDGIQVWVKHENHQPTNAFKVRNGLALMLSLTDQQRARGVIAASAGNHGQGLAWAGERLGVPVHIVAPVGANPDKIRAMRDLGVELELFGADYDAAADRARQRADAQGLVLAHSTEHPQVVAGAGTITLEMLDHQSAELDAMVVAIGGGSQAVGALVVAASRRPQLKVYGVQAEGAATIHDAWHAGDASRCRASVDTFADGLATRRTYSHSFPALRAGLEDFITVSDAEIAAAMRLLLRTTKSLAEPAGAAGLAGLVKLRARLHGQRVGVILSGGNVDLETLRRVVNREF